MADVEKKAVCSAYGPVIERECKDRLAPHGSDYYRLLVRNYPPELYAPFNISLCDLCFSCHNPHVYDRINQAVYLSDRDEAASSSRGDGGTPGAGSPIAHSKI